MTYSPFYFDKQGTGTAIALVTDYTNASAINPIPQGAMVSVLDSTGQIYPIDVSSNSSVIGRVGYVQYRIPTSSSGPVITNGRLENFTTSYPVGTALYVDTFGNPTSTVPVIGVNGFLSGYAVIFVGIVVMNEITPTSKDIQLMTQYIGNL